MPHNDCKRSAGLHTAPPLPRRAGVACRAAGFHSAAASPSAAAGCCAIGSPTGRGNRAAFDSRNARAATGPPRAGTVTATRCYADRTRARPSPAGRAASGRWRLLWLAQKAAGRWLTGVLAVYPAFDCELSSGRSLLGRPCKRLTHCGAAVIRSGPLLEKPGGARPLRLLAPQLQCWPRTVR